MTNMNIDELKKLALEKKVIFGSNDVIRKLKQGKIKKAFLASNIPKDVEKDIQHNASITKVDIEKIELPNDEFGMLFKRVHPVLVIGVLKD